MQKPDLWMGLKRIPLRVDLLPPERWIEQHETWNRLLAAADELSGRGGNLARSDQILLLLGLRAVAMQILRSQHDRSMVLRMMALLPDHTAAKSVDDAIMWAQNLIEFLTAERPTPVD
jgi:hypothetical protein